MMKTLISILVACLTAISAWGTRVVTFETNPNACYPCVIPLEFHSDGVTLSVFGTASMGGFSFYGYEMSFISTNKGVITDIVFENPSCNFIFSSGTYYTSGSNGYWSGTAQQVFFHPTGFHEYTGKVIVTVDDGSEYGPDDYSTLIAIYQNGNYNYCTALNDEYVLLYGDLGDTFANGDTIVGEVEMSTYGNRPVFTPVDDWFFVAHGPVVLPMEKPIEDLSQDMIHQYLCFKNVEMSDSWVISDDTGDLPMFNKFDIEIGWQYAPTVYDEITIATVNALIDRILSGNVHVGQSYYTYYVEGFLSVYRDQLELYPIHITRLCGWGDDINGDGEVNLSDVNAIIDYILSPNNKKNTSQHNEAAY